MIELVVKMRGIFVVGGSIELGLLLFFFLKWGKGKYVI